MRARYFVMQVRSIFPVSLCLCGEKVLEPSRGHAQEAPVAGGLNCHAQQIVCAVVERNEAKRLKDASLPFADWMQHLGHAFYAARLGLERDLDEIAGGEGARELQEAAIHGNDVNVALRPLTVSELNDYRCGC